MSLVLMIRNFIFSELIVQMKNNTFVLWKDSIGIPESKNYSVLEEIVLDKFLRGSLEEMSLVQ